MANPDAFTPVVKAQVNGKIGPGGDGGEQDRLRGWDPMREHSLHESNRYAHLANDQQPFYEARQRERGVTNDDDDNDDLLSSRRPFGLRVTNIPAGMNEDGIRNLFSKHGQIVDLQYRKNSGSSGQGWAKVSYSTHLEAQTAAQRLDRAEPFGLHVFNCLPEEEIARRRHQSLALAKFDENNVPPSGWTEDANKSKIGGSASSVASISGGGGNASRSASASSLNRIMRTVYSEADMEPKTFGRPLIVPFSRPLPCSYCRGEGRLRCSRCKAWYCSQKCQIEHWQYHKDECVEPPPLEHPDGTPFRHPRDALRQPLGPLPQKATQTETSVTTTNSGSRALIVTAAAMPVSETPVKIKPSANHLEETKNQTKKAEDKTEAKNEAKIASKVEETKPRANFEEAKVEEAKIQAKVEEAKVKAKVEVKKDIEEPKPTQPEPTTKPQPSTNQTQSAPSLPPVKIINVAEKESHSQKVKTVPPQPMVAKSVVQKTCTKSILSQLAQGSERDIYIEVADGSKFNTNDFCASILDESAFEFILGEMQEQWAGLEGKLSPFKSVQAGQLVVAKKEDGSFTRGFILATKGDQAMVVNIDIGHKEKFNISNLYEMQATDSDKYMALGIHLTALNSAENVVLAQAVLEDPLAIIKLTSFSKDTCIGRCDLTVNSKKAGSYDIIPWYYSDDRITSLIGIPHQPKAQKSKDSAEAAAEAAKKKNQEEKIRAMEEQLRQMKASLEEGEGGEHQ